MNNLNRRKFLGIGCTTLAAGLIHTKAFSQGIDSGNKAIGITPTIHATDLLQPFLMLPALFTGCLV
jgi:hypothetical protein